MPILPEQSGKDRIYFQAGMDIILHEVPAFLSFIILGFLLSIPLQMTLFLFAGSLLRLNTGSFHAGTHMKCYAFSLANAAAAGCLIRLSNMHTASFLTCAALLCSCFIASNAPLVHYHNPLSDAEKSRAAFCTRVLLFIYIVFMLACLHAYSSFAASFACSLIHIALCMKLFLIEHQEIQP